MIGFGQGWKKTYGGAGEEAAYSVQQTTDGGYIITGYTNSFGNGGSDVYLLKTDENGVEQWSQTFGGISDDVGYSVEQTSDGGYIIAGTRSAPSNTTFDAIYLVKTDGNGTQQWSQTFVEWNGLQGFSVQQTSDGGYIISGRVQLFI